jgi:hypothetical protein
VTGDGASAAVTWTDDWNLKAKVATGGVAAPWTRSPLGNGWWGTPVPVAAGGGVIAAAWAAPGIVGNANTAKLVARTFA